MNIENIDTLNLLLACNCILVAAATVAILRFQRSTNQRASPLNDAAEATNASTTAAKPDSDDFLKAVERRFATLENGIGSMRRDSETGSAVARSVPHENAVRMVKHGATVDDLTRTCGLSDIEARLLMRVHGTQAHAAKVN